MALPYRRITSEHSKYPVFHLIHGVLELTCRISSLIDFRGSYRVARYAARWMPGPEEITVMMDDDIIVSFPKSEPYWLRLLCRSYNYEPEIVHILRRLRHESYAFVDAGANIGYWSVLASSKRFGGKKTIAVEPLSVNIRWISRNWELNDKRFAYVHGALHWQDVGEVSIYSHMSESPTRPGASVVGEAGEHVIERARAYRFRDLISGFGLDKDTLLVKLDVEGIERFLAEDIYRQREDVLVVYEDHGKDRSCSNTSWFLREFGSVWHVDRKGRFVPLTDVEQIKSIKRRRGVGYNFLSGPRDLVRRMLGD